MKTSQLILRVGLLCSLFMATGCQTHGNDPVISFKQPNRAPLVETENIQWDMTTERNQELDDEI